MKISPLDHGIKKINYKYLYEKSLFEIDQLKKLAAASATDARNIII